MRFTYALVLGVTMMACEQPKETSAVAPAQDPGAADAAASETSVDPRAELATRVIRDNGVWVYQLDATAPHPWVVKSTTPFDLTLRPSEGVRLPRNVFTRRDIVDPDAAVKRIQAELQADPGEHTIEADVELYVCTAAVCKRVKESLRTAFTIPKS